MICLISDDRCDQFIHVWDASMQFCCPYCMSQKGEYFKSCLSQAEEHISDEFDLTVKLWKWQINFIWNLLPSKCIWVPVFCFYEEHLWSFLKCSDSTQKSKCEDKKSWIVAEGWETWMWRDERGSAGFLKLSAVVKLEWGGSIFPSRLNFPIKAPVLAPAQPRCSSWESQENWPVCWCPPGGLSKLSSDPVKLVNDAVEESTHLIGAMLKFAANLIAPEEDQGSGAPCLYPAAYYHMHYVVFRGQSEYLLAYIFQ